MHGSMDWLSWLCLLVYWKWICLLSGIFLLSVGGTLFLLRRQREAKKRKSNDLRK